MTVLKSKKTDPLFIEFDVNGVVDNEPVIFLWEDDLYKSILHCDLVKLRNNVIYFSGLNKSLNFFKNDISFKIVSLQNYNIIFEYKFKNLYFVDGKKINFISQNNNTGYGYASRNYIYQLINQEYDVYWNVKKFYENSYKSSGLNEKHIFDKLDKQSENDEYDTCIIKTTPNDWQRIIQNEDITCKKLLGSTVWETTKLNKKWIDIINNSDVEEVIVPSQFNYEVFKKSGIEKPLHIWRYDIFPPEINNLISLTNFTNKFNLFKNGKFIIDDIQIYNILQTKTVYYNISQYSERKNIDQLIKTFCTKFTKEDKVCLFVKTFLRDIIPSQIEYLKYKINEIVKYFKNPPDLIFCFQELTDIEIQALHYNFDIYFTLNRGEGFGLCSYTAKKFGNKVICGKFGAEKEFLDNSDILIDYELIPTFNMHLFHSYYDDNDQMWASYKDSDVLKVLEYIPKKIK